MSLQELIEELKKVDRTRGPGYAADCESILARIVELNDPSSIEHLVPFFEDDPPYDEVMFSIVHSIEVFEDQLYVAHLLSVAAEFCANSPRWASIVFMRIINSEPTKGELIHQLPNATESAKAAIRQLMEKINNRRAEFTAKTTPIIIAASPPYRGRSTINTTPTTGSDEDGNED